MRIYLKLTPNTTTIPFNYQPLLTGALHKWLGKENVEHGKPSLYSFSWLQNVRPKEDGIDLRPDSHFFISAHDEGLVKRIVSGILDDRSVCHGAFVSDVQIALPPVFKRIQTFYTASPVFVKRRSPDHKQEHHLLYSDMAADAALTETLQKKLELAGLPAADVLVGFDRTYNQPKTKVITYNGIGNRVNVCPVVISGTPEQLAFAWHVGVGNSTGIGFGALK